MADANVFIKFDSEKILDLSNNLNREYKNFIECTANIKRESEGLNGIWQSDSATFYAYKLNELDVKSEEIAQKLLSFIQQLANISGLYKFGEDSVKQKAEALPTEGVFLG